MSTVVDFAPLVQAAAGISPTQQLAAATAKIKTLEDEYEPKKDAPR